MLQAGRHIQTHLKDQILVSVPGVRSLRKLQETQDAPASLRTWNSSRDDILDEFSIFQLSWECDQQESRWIRQHAADENTPRFSVSPGKPSG